MQRLHRCIILTCMIFHHQTRANVITCPIPVFPSILQYMLNYVDLLHNPGVYTNGYSICVCSFCVPENGTGSNPQRLYFYIYALAHGHRLRFYSTGAGLWTVNTVIGCEQGQGTAGDFIVQP